jgi:tRNA(fMet)-specific endonuclease VapC
MIVLDTDTFTHHSYGNENVRRKIEAVEADELAVAIVTRNEVLRGRAESLLKAATVDELRTASERIQQTEALLDEFHVVHFDETAIQHFGQLKKVKALKKMGRADMLIACIALANDALLVTRNTKDYKDVPGLRLANWVD